MSTTTLQYKEVHAGADLCVAAVLLSIWTLTTILTGLGVFTTEIAMWCSLPALVVGVPKLVTGYAHYKLYGA